MDPHSASPPLALEDDWGYTLRIAGDGPLLLGRSPRCRLPLPTAEILAAHARFRLVCGHWTVAPATPDASVRVNGCVITTDCPVEPGDTVALDGLDLHVVVHQNEEGI